MVDAGSARATERGAAAGTSAAGTSAAGAAGAAGVSVAVGVELGVVVAEVDGVADPSAVGVVLLDGSEPDGLGVAGASAAAGSAAASELASTRARPVARARRSAMGSPPAVVVAGCIRSGQPR
jgi:hypothetical protein